MPLKNKKICLTGAAGFLGRHLLPMLVDAGAEVTCLIRSSGITFTGNARIERGDCETGAGLRETLAGQDILVHMAGLLFGTSWQDYLRANGRSARNIVRCLADLGEQGPKKIVFVSSLAAAGPCAAPPGLDGDCVPDPVSAYGWSKLLAEDILATAGRILTILRPPIIYGSGDRGLLPLFRIAGLGIGISPGLAREFPVSIIHADDAARAIVLAAASAEGGIYHLSDGQIHTMSGLCRAMGAAQGRSRVFVATMPLPLMAITAVCGSAYGWILKTSGRVPCLRAKRPPSWNFDKYRESARSGWLADAALIRARLGFVPVVTLEAGMREAVAGYRAEGWL